MDIFRPCLTFPKEAKNHLTKILHRCIIIFPLNSQLFPFPEKLILENPALKLGMCVSPLYNTATTAYIQSKARVNASRLSE